MFVGVSSVVITSLALYLYNSLTLFFISGTASSRTHGPSKLSQKQFDFTGINFPHITHILLFVYLLHTIMFSSFSSSHPIILYTVFLILFIGRASVFFSYHLSLIFFLSLSVLLLFIKNNFSPIIIFLLLELLTYYMLTLLVGLHGSSKQLFISVIWYLLFNFMVSLVGFFAILSINLYANFYEIMLTLMITLKVGPGVWVLIYRKFYKLFSVEILFIYNAYFYILLLPISFYFLIFHFELSFQKFWLPLSTLFMIYLISTQPTISRIFDFMVFSSAIFGLFIFVTISL